MDKEVSLLLKEHNEQIILEYFDIQAWISSKLHKSSFLKELLKAK